MSNRWSCVLYPHKTDKRRSEKRCHTRILWDLRMISFCHRLQNSIICFDMNNWEPPPEVKHLSRSNVCPAHIRQNYSSESFQGYKYVRGVVIADFISHICKKASTKFLWFLSFCDSSRVELHSKIVENDSILACQLIFNVYIKFLCDSIVLLDFLKRSDFAT